MQINHIRPEQGFHSNGIIDFSPVLSKMLSEVMDGTTFTFASGEYHFWPDNAINRKMFLSNTDSAKHPQKDIAILIENKKNITLLGENTFFIFHGKVMMFAILNCDNIRIEGISFDYACPSTVDVTVEKNQITGENSVAEICIPPVYSFETDGKNVTWQSEKSPYSGVAYWAGKNGLELSQHYHRNNGFVNRTDEDLFYKCSSIEKIGLNKLRIVYDGIRNFESGDAFQMRYTVRDSSGIFITESSNIVFSRLNIGFMHGIGIICQCTDNLEIGHVNFKTIDAQKTTASAADFIQVSGCKGRIWIHDSVFVNPHDDHINIHGTFLRLVKNEGSKITLRYCHDQTLGFKSVFAGDILQFYNSSTLIPVGRPYTVLSSCGPDCDNLDLMEIELDRTFLETVGKAASGNNTSEYDLVAENLTWIPEVLIENNSFEACPTRAVLVTVSGKVVIRNNTFEHILMAGIFISCDAGGWYESGPVKDVLIEKNSFVNCSSHAVLVEPTNAVLCQNEKVHTNIRIHENIIKGFIPCAFQIKSGDNISISNNSIELQDEASDFSIIKNISSNIEESDNKIYFYSKTIQAGY